MAIDIVTWRIIKKWYIWSFHLRNFLWLPISVMFFENYADWDIIIQISYKYF